MSYQGGTNSKQFPELESVRRLREGGPGSGPHSGGGGKEKSSGSKDSTRVPGASKAVTALRNAAKKSGHTEKVRSLLLRSADAIERTGGKLSTMEKVSEKLGDAFERLDYGRASLFEKASNTVDELIENHLSDANNPENKYMPHY